MNANNVQHVSGYDLTIELNQEGNRLALYLLKQCHDWVVTHGPDRTFTASWVLGGISALNLRALSSRGILEKVGSSRGGHRAYYRMVDPEGVAEALRAIGLA